MSPRTQEQNQALREESRARIIAAALGLFSAQGYERTTVKQIAQAAGVAQGLMYAHFASKEDLLRALFAESVADVYASFALAEAGDPRQPAPERLIRAAFTIMREKRDFWRLVYGLRMQQPVLAALGTDIFAWAATIRETLEGYFRSAGVEQPQIEAELLFATIDGAAQHYVLEPERYPLEAVVEALVRRYRL